MGNLRRQHEKVDVAEDQIADAVEKVITSHAVSASIASLALKVADERAMQADGNTFLEPKPQQQLKLLRGVATATSTKEPGKAAAAAAAAAAPAGPKGRGGLGATADARHQQLAAKGAEPEPFEPSDLVYDKAALRALPQSYPESGFARHPSASRGWNAAMGEWEEEGIAAKPADKYPPLASGAALSNPDQLGLSALALQALAANPAAGVAGPVAGAFGGLWTQGDADGVAAANEKAIASGRQPGDNSAYYGSGPLSSALSSPAQIYLAARRSVRQQLRKKKGGEKGKKGAAPAGPAAEGLSSAGGTPFTNGPVELPTAAPSEGSCAGACVGWGVGGELCVCVCVCGKECVCERESEKGVSERASECGVYARSLPGQPSVLRQCVSENTHLYSLTDFTQLSPRVRAACLVCSECCASGWIPGCGGYDEAKGDEAAAALAKR